MGSPNSSLARVKPVAVYLVTGQCGDHGSRRHEWIVCWFPTLGEANEHADLCREQYAARRLNPATRVKAPADSFVSPLEDAGVTYEVCMCKRGPVQS